MIRNFADKETERIWNRERSRKLPSELQSVMLRKLRQLNRITHPAELRVPPGNRFEELKGDRKGAYSIRVNDQWRITFRWYDGGAYDVRIEDYHR
ncbi:MAG: type II toxin-antitoxin system RelE/ParE family toxin [Sphingomonas sp.]